MKKEYWYEDKVRLKITLSNSRYKGEGHYGLTFDDFEDAEEWAEEKGFIIDGESGEGYSDGEGCWALSDGILYTQDDDTIGLGGEVEEFDRAYCDCEDITIKHLKQDVIIDKYHDESGHAFFRVVLNEGNYDTPPDGLDTGWFISEYDIDDHLDKLNVVRDYR